MNLGDLSKQLSNLITKTSQQVVSVHGRRGYPLSGTIWSEHLIVTTHRAVERAENISIVLADGASHHATLVGRDPRKDVAVLKLDTPLSVPNYTDAENLNVGQLVLRLGRSSQGMKATLGILSALTEGAIYTDADSFPGFSGGPLIDMEGNILGLSSSAFSNDQSALIPTNILKATVAELLEYGRIRRPYLGIMGQPVKLPEQLRESLHQRAGLLIMSVEPDSPAAKAGLAMGDTLFSLNGEKIYRPDHVFGALKSSHIGQTLPITILRGGELKEVSLTVGEK